MDRFSVIKRSQIMASIGSKDTKPEQVVRKILHALGFRFRLHRKDLPGKPDIVLPRYGVALFVHGCFWHGHDCKKGRSTPKSNVAFWENKIIQNKKRDEIARTKLEESGWTVLIIWECQVIDQETLATRILKRLPRKRNISL